MSNQFTATQLKKHKMSTQAISKRINIYEMGTFQPRYYGNQNPGTFKWCIKISSAEIFYFIN